MNYNSRYHHTAVQMEEEHLIIEDAKINPNSFAPIYDKYYKQIFGYLYQRSDCKETAFDLTAQVFLKAMLNLNKYEYKGVPFASWLYRIAHSELMQMFREKKNKRAINADVGDLKFICEEAEEFYLEEYIPVLKTAIAALAPEDLQMVELRFFEKRAFKEIGEILDITENNAKVRMYRIIEKLKKVITQKKN